MRLFTNSLACALALWPGLALAQSAPAPPTPQSTHAAPLPMPRTMPAPRRYERVAEVQLRDFAGIVIVRPENRTDVAVSIHNPGPLRAPEVRTTGRRLTIDGKLRRQIRSCRAEGPRFDVTVNRIGRLAIDALPVIELRTPQNVVLTGNGAMRVHIGRAENVQLRLEGCGDADLESVENAADLTVSGAIDLRAYDSGEASVRVAGDGDVTLGVVREGLAAALAGSGDLVAARVDGPTNIAIQGMGDVTIRDGRATVLSVAIMGAGDVTHNGSAERLDVAIFGGGDVRVARVDGQVTRRVFGGGDVTVGR